MVPTISYIVLYNVIRECITSVMTFIGSYKFLYMIIGPIFLEDMSSTLVVTSVYLITQMRNTS